MAHARIEQFEAKLAITSGRREAAEAWYKMSSDQNPSFLLYTPWKINMEK